MTKTPEPPPTPPSEPEKPKRSRGSYLSPTPVHVPKDIERKAFEAFCNMPGEKIKVKDVMNEINAKLGTKLSINWINRRLCDGGWRAKKIAMGALGVTEAKSKDAAILAALREEGAEIGDKTVQALRGLQSRILANMALRIADAEPDYIRGFIEAFDLIETIAMRRSQTNLAATGEVPVVDKPHMNGGDAVVQFGKFGPRAEPKAAPK